MSKKKPYRRKLRMESHSRNAKDLQAVALALLALDVRMELTYGKASTRRGLCLAAIAAVKALYLVLDESAKKERAPLAYYPPFPHRGHLSDEGKYPSLP